MIRDQQQKNGNHDFAHGASDNIYKNNYI